MGEWSVIAIVNNHPIPHSLLSTSKVINGNFQDIPWILGLIYIYIYTWKIWQVAPIVAFQLYGRWCHVYFFKVGPNIANIPGVLAWWFHWAFTMGWLVGMSSIFLRDWCTTRSWLCQVRGWALCFDNPTNKSNAWPWKNGEIDSKPLDFRVPNFQTNSSGKAVKGKEG